MTRTTLAVTVLLLGANGLQAQSAAQLLRSCGLDCKVERPAAQAVSPRPAVTAVAPKSAPSMTSEAPARAVPAAAEAPSSRDVQRLTVRQAAVSNPRVEAPVTAGSRPLSVTMQPSSRGEAGDRGRGAGWRDGGDRDRGYHGGRQRGGYGWGYWPGRGGTGVEIGIEIADIGLDIADIGLYGLRDNVIAGNWRGGDADIIAAELPAERIEITANGSFAWGETRGRAREVVPHFARGGDRFFLIRDGGDEYVIMIDAAGEARLLDGLDAIRRGDHLR